MYEFIQRLHSGVAYLALLLLVIAIVNSRTYYEEFAPKDRKLALFALIFAHTQLLIGLILYFLSPLGYSNIANLGMGEVMKNPEFRQMVVEHPVINIIAVVLITIGWSKHKKSSTSQGKFKNILIFYALGLLLILSRIPWSTWM